MPVVFECDVDTSAWLAIPESWSEGAYADPQLWARAVADELFGDSPDHDAAVRSFAAVATSRTGNDRPSDRTYVFIADRRLPPSVVDIVLFPAEGEAQERHRYLTRADAPGAVGAIQVEPIDAEHLGAGMSVLRFDPVGSDLSMAPVVGTWRAVWRFGDYDVMFALFCAGPDALMNTLASGIALARSLRPVGASGQQACHYQDDGDQRRHSLDERSRELRR
jgi:hypothetical protein